MARIAIFLAVGSLCIGCSQQSPSVGESKDPESARVTAGPPAAAIAATPAEPDKPLEVLETDGAKTDLKVSLTDAPAVDAAAEPAKGPMRVYVSPFYSADGPKINVGDYSTELTEATADTIGKVTEKMKMDWPTLSPEAMYVTSIRLYDLGQKDDAVYWYYAAQFRARLFQSVLVKESIGRIGAEGFERAQAYGAFHNLAGKYINGYAFGDLEKLLVAIERVKNDNQEVPQLKTIYPRLVFVAEQDWPDHRQEIAAGLDRFVDYIKNNADQIKDHRKENGMDKKY